MYTCRCGWRMPETCARSIAAHEAGHADAVAAGSVVKSQREAVRESQWEAVIDSSLRFDSHSRPYIHASGSDSITTTRRYRRCLFTADPHCYWCGRLTVWVTPANGVLAPDTATVDHVVSKYNRPWNSPTDLVLACFECNQRRSVEEQRERLAVRRQAGYAGEELGQ